MDTIDQNCFPHTRAFKNTSRAVLALSFTGGSASAFIPLIERLSHHCIPVFALELPGHGTRSQESPMNRCDHIAQYVYKKIASIWTRYDWYIVAHDVGTWIAYELYKIIRSEKKNLPRQLILSCFPAPCIGIMKRPWSSSIKQSIYEELCSWDINPHQNGMSILLHSQMTRCCLRLIQSLPQYP